LREVGREDWSWFGIEGVNQGGVVRKRLVCERCVRENWEEGVPAHLIYLFRKGPVRIGNISLSAFDLLWHTSTFPRQHGLAALTQMA
jgi:hypothetical protein